MYLNGLQGGVVCVLVCFCGLLSWVVLRGFKVSYVDLALTLLDSGVCLQLWIGVDFY